MGSLQLGHEIAGGRRGRAREREEQESLGYEPLREGSGGDAGFGGDLGQGELAGGEPVGRAMRRSKDLVVADFSRAWAHGEGGGLDVSKRSYSLKLNANVV